MTASLEDAKILDIDEWGTLATAPSPTKLGKGQTPNAKNVWVDEKPGSVITAPGLLKVGTLPSGNPPTFCINYFKTSAGTQTFVVSDNATVWTTVDFQNFTSIITGLSSAFQLRGAVIRDKLWLTNGSDAVRTFDGSVVVVLDGTGGNPTAPKGRYIAYHDERVWMYHVSGARSQTAFSALTDSSGTIIAPDNASAWPSSNTLQISEGDADFGTGLLLYRGYLHFFKQYSIWRLVGYDEYTYSRVKTRASTGTRFNESVQVLDSLVHLIGIDGIYVFDGEETSRISDLIDPATASQTAFGFNQLQQPNTNNLFWEVSSTSDWNAGTIPADLAVNDQIAYRAADDSQSDFQAGAVLTNIDTTRVPGTIRSSLSNAGSASENVALNQPVALSVSGVGTSQIGQGSYATDGDLTNAVGIQNGGTAIFTITLPMSLKITRVILKNAINTNHNILITILDQSDNVIATSSATPSSTARDVTVSFSVATCTSVKIKIVQSGGIFGGGSGSDLATVADIQVYTSAYEASSSFTSRTLDLGGTPNSLGQFSAAYSLNGQAITFHTQSSANGISWDAAVAVTPGASIGSTARRYLRWTADFTSDGTTSANIDAVYLPAVYLSAIHNTGGSIYAWGPLESDRTLPLQVNYYYRTATTLIGVSSAIWNAIVPGGVINDAVANQYIQFKIEILNGTSTLLPVVNSVTINWIKGSGTQVATLQNVASYAWRNRYWLSAAGPGATANDTVLIRGKKTFGSPWQLKDFRLLCFTRYQDSLYAGSSIDGSIYRIDTGYSNNGLAIDSYFETGDFLFGGFYINPMELLIEVERMGPYSLMLGVSIDRGNTWTDYAVDLTISTFAQSYVKRINMASLNTDRIRFRVRTNGADQPFQVHNIRFYYKMEAPRGSIK